MILDTLKVVFLGSSNHCLPVLEALNKNYRVNAIITRAKGLPKQFALSHNIEVLTPANKDELLKLKDKIAALTPDLAIVADYGLIIAKEIFTLPRYKTINIHFSKLPKLRGPSPIQYTILGGEKSAWISLIIMDEGIDTGNIIWQKEVKLSGNETADTLYKKLFNITARELPAVLSDFVQNQLRSVKQDHHQATYTKILNREDGFIPFPVLTSAIKGEKLTETQIQSWPIYKLLSNKFLIHNSKFIILIERALRAFSPWPGLWTEAEIKQPPRLEESEIRSKKRLKILKAHLEGDKLVLDQVQLEGKKPVSWKQFKEGYPSVDLIL